jgi:hypothetical protein
MWRDGEGKRGAVPNRSDQAGPAKWAAAVYSTKMGSGPARNPPAGAPRQDSAKAGPCKKTTPPDFDPRACGLPEASSPIGQDCGTIDARSNVDNIMSADGEWRPPLRWNNIRRSKALERI